MHHKFLRGHPGIANNLVTLLKGPGRKGLRPNDLVFHGIDRCICKFCEGGRHRPERPNGPGSLLFIVVPIAIVEYVAMDGNNSISGFRLPTSRRCPAVGMPQSCKTAGLVKPNGLVSIPLFTYQCWAFVPPVQPILRRAALRPVFTSGRTVSGEKLPEVFGFSRTVDPLGKRCAGWSGQ